MVLDSIQPSGDFPTYDADNHVLDVGLPRSRFGTLLDELQPGEYLEFSYDVYARQKPGVQWTAPVRDTVNTPDFQHSWF